MKVVASMAAVAVAAAVCGCSTDATELRRQQAQQVKDLCVSLLLRHGASRDDAEAVRRAPVEEFEVSGAGEPVSVLAAVRAFCP